MAWPPQYLDAMDENQLVARSNQQGLETRQKREKRRNKFSIE